MKKGWLFFCILLGAVLCLALTACGGEETPSVTTEPPDLSGVSLPDGTFVYDGTEKSLSVSGTLPAGVTVAYENNGQTNAGVYTVTAQFYRDGVLIPGGDRSATLTIEKAVYDMSRIVFNGKTLTYNGRGRSVDIAGRLPEGVEVSYRIEGAEEMKNAGVYTVYAVFTGDAVNYEPIPEMSATVTINKASFNMSKVTFDSVRTEFDGTVHSIFLTGLPDGLTATYTGNSACRIGTYSATATFAPDDPANYETPAPLTATIEIVPGTYGTEGLSFEALPDGSCMLTGYTGGGMDVVIPDTWQGLPVSRVGDGVFAGKTAVSYIYMPDTVQTVGANAFSGCTALSEVRLSEALDLIGDGAFSGCGALRTLYLPASVTQIGNAPFTACDELVVVLEADTPEGAAPGWTETDAGVGVRVIRFKSYAEYLANRTLFADADMGDATAVSLAVDSTVLPGFDREVTDYTADADINTGYPVVTVQPGSVAAYATVEQASHVNGGVATVTVTSGDGSANETYKIVFQMTGTFESSAEIVNKDGAQGVVSYVVDDGVISTAEFAMEMLRKYRSLAFSFAIKTQDLATLRTQTGEDGKTEYVTEDGRYVYDINTAKVEFWRAVLELGRNELVSHTHTHSFWGTNDDGGTFRYVTNAGEAMTSPEMPKGSSSKELYASRQILQDLFPRATYPAQRALALVEPGIGVLTVDQTVDGERIPSYKTYYNQLVKQALAEGSYIGSRGTFIATDGYETRVNMPENFITETGRMNVKAFMILNNNAGDDIVNWKNYIDAALEQQGWACFCIHQMTPDEIGSHHILQSQADQLFAYTESLGDTVWVATLTDAMLYYFEWSTARLETAYADGTVTVTLTDGESDEIFDMPLTVKVAVPANWPSARCGENLLEIRQNQDGSCYVYVDIVPDSGTVELTPGS